MGAESDRNDNAAAGEFCELSVQLPGSPVVCLCLSVCPSSSRLQSCGA